MVPKKSGLHGPLRWASLGKDWQVLAGQFSVGGSVGRTTWREDVETTYAKTYTKKPEPLTAAIIADMALGEERGDAQAPGLRVRCSSTRKKVFFFATVPRSALREIILGDVGR